MNSEHDLVAMRDIPAVRDRLPAAGREAHKKTGLANASGFRGSELAERGARQ